MGAAMSENGLRLRQAVLAARDLDAVAGRLRAELGLGEPFADPNVAHFGLRNAVFALGDTFLEVVSPVAEDTAAGRWIERRGGDCGYMLMFQVGDVEAARARAGELAVREVFEASASTRSSRSSSTTSPRRTCTPRTCAAPSCR
jgi:Glyoxalase-like domain